MAVTIIEQRPLYNLLPVGQEIIFVVSNEDAVLNQTRVKFVAEVHISTTNPVLNTTTDLIGTFKTTPNNAGVGMFDLRSIAENYLNSDNMAADGSAYKLTTTSSSARHPLHLIDKFSLNTNAYRFMAIRFAVEYLGATDTAGQQNANIVRIAAGSEVDSNTQNLWNGYLKYSDILLIDTTGSGAGRFGFDFKPFILSDNESRFLTNAPTTQYANLEDYGTVSFLTAITDVTRINLVYKNSVGVGIGAENVDLTAANGAYTNILTSNDALLHFGCFPANLRNYSTLFNGLVTAGTIQGGSIEVTALSSSDQRSQTYTIDLNCPNTKGYEPIRLCWLNQWGAWDYYTFTKKSVKSISTQGTTYDQLAGTWNESRYRIDSFKGGKKAFRVNSTERISMNTGFVAENENVMFEELINSPEVYELKGYGDDPFDALSPSKKSALNKYVTPVRLTTSSFTRKTSANDRLLQYTFEIEKSKTLRTQSV
jgi:hypothetical protein